MQRVFISDLHLAEERPQVIAAFFAFLARGLGECDELYILGDFFDAWVGDDDDRPLVLQVKTALQAVASRGIGLFFQPGYRDFLLGEAFAQDIPLQLLPEEYVIEAGGRRYLLAHGDQYCTGDAAYQQFRAMVRQPAWQQELLGKTLAERRAIAQMLREKSREQNSIKACDIMDVTEAAVQQAMMAHDCQVLIHGHTHRPAVHSIAFTSCKPAERVVLGEWDETFWYVRLDDAGAKLICEQTAHWAA